MVTVYIGMGSNMETPIQQLQTALDELHNIKNTTLINCSSFYKSKPVGPQDQADFINAVAELSTTLSALELLEALQAIEQVHQRVRERHWGPRTLDLDVLLYGEEQIENERLIVPHKEMLNRNFVLIPLFELSGDMIIPGANSLKTYVESCDKTTIIKLEHE